MGKVKTLNGPCYTTSRVVRTYFDLGDLLPDNKIEDFRKHQPGKIWARTAFIPHNYDFIHVPRCHIYPFLICVYQWAKRARWSVVSKVHCASDETSIHKTYIQFVIIRLGSHEKHSTFIITHLKIEGRPFHTIVNNRQRYI